MIFENLKIKPPKIAQWIFKFIFPDQGQLTTIGDMEEVYLYLVDEKGIYNAWAWYWLQLFRSIPHIIGNSIFTNAAMVKNYIKIAVRNIIWQKGYSFISISGLALGMASFILISLWVADELSFDQFHENKDRIYKVNTTTGTFGIKNQSSWRLGPAFKKNYPEIESYSRLWRTSSLVKYKDIIHRQPKFFLADPAFFVMFSFEFLKGSPETALSEKNSIVITERIAIRYFGNKNPLGESLYVEKYKKDFKISGVVKNIPRRSSMRFDFMAHIDNMSKQRLESWDFTGITFVMIKENTTEEEVNGKIYTFYKEHVDPGSDYSAILQPLTKIHLNENTILSNLKDGSPALNKQISILSVVAIFILLIACINFMNLSTARAAKRSREVGIRKMAGAFRSQIIKQFLGESIVLSFISLILAIILIIIILPFFNDIVYKQLSLFSGEIAETLLFLIATSLLTGVVAGSYPAIYFSSFKIANILKGNKVSSKGNQISRKTLIVVQFTISIGLIICTLIVHQQLNFIQTKDLGVQREHVISLPNNPIQNSRFDHYRNELVSSGLVESVTASATCPINIHQNIGVYRNKDHNKEEIQLSYTMIDYDYFKTFDIEFLAGRTFSPEIKSDKTEACIINELAVKIMGLKEPVGSEVYFGPGAFDIANKKVKIIGVVKDYHNRTLYEDIKPFIFLMDRPRNSFVYIKLKPDNIPKAISHIEKTTKKISPDYPFLFRFLNEFYNQIYIFERMLGKIFNIFAFLAVFISCLGLLGLVSFNIEQRAKELSIRKTMGASVYKIVFMLSKEFTKLIVLANLIACPLALYFIYRWLGNFTYKIQIELWVFVLSAGIVLIFALFIVFIQSFKAATANPVDALKYE